MSKAHRNSTRPVPFARGFVRPTEVERAAAAADAADLRLGKSRRHEAVFVSDDDLFKPVPAPRSRDDWLAQYNEVPQDFLEYLDENPWLSEGEPRPGYRASFYRQESKLSSRYPDGKIYLAQLGDLGDSSSTVAPSLETLAEFARIYLNLPVEILGRFAVSQEGEVLHAEIGHQKLKRIRLRLRRRGEKVQLHCPSLLYRLRTLVPPDGFCLVTLTDFDLYESAPDLFVAGLANASYRVALFSLARYDPVITFSKEFWYQLRKNQRKVGTARRKKLILVRSCKLLVHEIGHLLGLPHCVFYSCCMNGSGHLEEDFRQPIFLCPVCLKKLSMLTEVDFVDRYRAMDEFFATHHVAEERQWLQLRLKKLSQP